MNIGIVGLGLMGGSIAKVLYGRYNIHAYDQDQGAIEYALKHQIIDYGYSDVEAFFKATDVIYLCLYPRTLVDFMKQYAKFIKKDSVLIEISGVKTELVKLIDPYIDNRFDFIYSHPIAGREKVGVASSKVSIFVNANYVICPLEKNQTKNLELTEMLARLMGFSSISYLSPEKHDEIIAYTSQLTHLLSLVLVQSDTQAFDTGKFIGDSYRDLTRIAMINAPLWAELFLENRGNLLEKIENFKKVLNDYETCIKNNDVTTLIELMHTAKTIRLSLEKEE
jgi:prephenate dehydrogenase